MKGRVTQDALGRWEILDLRKAGFTSPVAGYILFLFEGQSEPPAWCAARQEALPVGLGGPRPPSGGVGAAPPTAQPKPQECREVFPTWL
jgi:hypothetical protein